MKKISSISMFFIIFLICSAYSAGYETKYEYKLSYLKEAHPPKPLKLIRNRSDKTTTTLETGILFTYKNRKASEVNIAGDFSGWNTIKMHKSENGVWYYFLSNYTKLPQLRYKFMVDGIWLYDPVNPYKEADGAGSYVSLVNTAITPINKQVTYREIHRNKKYAYLEFRIYKPNASYVSVVGDFNNWNPENDVLKRDSNGIWHLRKKIQLGKYRYRFIIDGNKTLDLYNSRTASDPAGEICSLLIIE